MARAISQDVITRKPPAGTLAPARAPDTVPRPHRRRWLPGLVLLVLALGGAHAVLLHVMAGQIQAGLDQWAMQRRAQGWQVEYGATERGGWPYAATLRVPALRLAANGLDWRAGPVTLSVTPWRYDRLRMAAEGAQQVSLGGPPMALRTGSLRGELVLNGTAPPRAGSLRAESLQLDSPAGPVTLPLGSLNFDNTAAEALTFQARLRHLTLPVALPLGQMIEEITLDAVVFGPLDTTGTPALRATRWRDGGGRMEVQGATLRWGRMAASAAATLALDAGLQPAGAGTLRVANAAQTLDALAAAGLVPARAAATARRILPLLVRPDPGGGSPVIELPVTLEDRALALARIPLVKLGAVVW